MALHRNFDQQKSRGGAHSVTCPQQTEMGVMIFIAVIYMTSVLATQETNLLTNPSFEDAFPPRKDNPWLFGKNSVQTQDCSDAKSGKCSLRVQNRTSSIIGALQNVRGLKPGRGYALTGYMKILNNKKGVLWQAAKATLKFTFTDSVNQPGYVMMALADNETVPEEEKTRCIRSGEGQKQGANLKSDKVISYVIVYRGFVTAEDGWVSLSGDLNAPMRDFEDEVRFQVNGPDAEIDFLLDDLKLVEVPITPNWRDKANNDTEKYRKNKFNIKFTVPSDVDKNDVDVEVKLISHQFAFGAKIEPDCLLTPNAARYNNFTYSVFNWAAIGSYKWKMGQGQPGPPDFNDAVDTNKLLLHKGFKVRAHSILWGVPDNVPNWVKDITDPAKLRSTTVNHVEYMVNLTKGGLAAQWDVQNEWIHGQFYEERLQDPNFTMDVFKLVKSLDPNVKMYLNDFMGVTTGAQTQDLVDIVKRFRKYGAPIDGIGIQGHTKDYVKPDPTMIWRRLDKFAALTGLDVMVTEFDVGSNDDVIRADWLEDAMRAFYAHPVLEGVILWGFWNLRMRYENKYLVYGDRFTLAEGAIRFACLVKNEWTTQQTFNLSHYPDLTVSLNGYAGEYELIVRKKGVPVQRTKFLVNNPKTVRVTITRSDHPIALPQEYPDYVKECISHRNQHSMGKVTSKTSATSASCVARKQSRSLAHVSVSCKEGELLLGCSGSYTSGSGYKDYSSSRQGEVITLDAGVHTCHTYGKDMGNTFTVKAIARCCEVPALQCDYRQAGPSLQMPEALVETTCPDGASALGCTVYSEHTKQGGVVYRGNSTKSCVGKNGPTRTDTFKSGVVATAPCCTKSGMTCVAVRSTGTKSTSSGDRSQVTCPASGQLMTSCAGEGLNYRAEVLKDSNSNDVCTVFGVSALAIATCCSFA